MNNDRYPIQIMKGIRPPSTILNYRDTEILLLGENHTTSEFEDYILEELDNFGPEAVCVESCPQRFDMHSDHERKSSVGVTAATKYLSSLSQPSNLYLIDQSQSEFLDKIKFGGLPEDNSPPDKSIHSLNPLKVNFDEIREYNKTLQQTSPAKWETHCLNRSKYMASLIMDIVEDFGSDQLAVVTGLSHTVDIHDILEEEPESLSDPFLSENRIRKQ